MNRLQTSVGEFKKEGDSSIARKLHVFVIKQGANNKYRIATKSIHRHVISARKLCMKSEMS